MAHATADQAESTRLAASILVVDGNEEHQALSVATLGRRGYRVSVADSAREGLHAALASRFDVIILAHKLRGGSGFDALPAFAERLPSVPTVFVVPEGQEDLASRALSRGASGCLVKTARYNELLPAAVDEQLAKVRAAAQLRQEHRALEESQARYRELVETSAAARFVLDREDRFAAVDDTMCALTGHPREKLLAARASDVLAPETGSAESFTAWLHEGRGEPRKVRCVRMDGEAAFLEISPLASQDAASAGPAFVVRDITSRVEAEEALAKMRERLATVVASAPVVMFATDRDGTITVAEGKALADLGLAPKDLLGRNFIEILTTERPEMKGNLPRVLEDGESGSREVVFRGRVFETSYAPLRDDRGRIVGSIAVGTDVTERRQAEAALRRRDAILEATRHAAERLLRTPRWEEAIDSVLERLGEATGVSRVWIFGNSEREDGAVLTRELFEWDAAGVPSQIQQLSRPARPYADSGFARWEAVLGRGEVITGRIADFPESERSRLADQGVRALAVVPIFLGNRWWGSMGYDQCDREREWSLPETEALRAAANMLGSAIQRSLAEASLRERARQQLAVASFSQKALAATSIEDLLRECCQVAAGTLDAEYSGILELAPEGDALVYRCGTGWDADAGGRRILSSDAFSHEGFAILTSGNTTVTSLGSQAQFGIPPVFRELGIRSGMTALLRVGGRPYGVLGVHSKSKPFFSEDDVHFLEALANTVATALERLRAETARREASEAVRAVIESSPAAIIGVDLEGQVTTWNRAAEQIFGWRREDVLGHPLPTIPPGKEPEHERLRAEALRSRASTTVETTRCRRDGRILDVQLSMAPIFDAQGKVAGTLGVLTDITERKRGERVRAALYKISEAVNTARGLDELYTEIHRIVAELMPAKNLYITLYDPVSNMLSFPYFVDEKEERPPPQKPGRGLTEYVLRTGKPLLALPDVFDGMVVRGEAESVGPPSVDWLGVPLEEGGTTFGVLAVQSYTQGVRYTVQDRELLEFVSDQIAFAIQRKRAEEFVRESGERYRMLFDNNPQPMWVWDAETLRFLAVNQAAIRHYGYTREEFLSMTIKDIRPPEDVPRLLALAARLPSGVSESGTWRHRRKDGTVLDVDVVSHDIEFGGRHGRLVLASDITARRRAEAQLARSELRYRTLFESSTDGILLATLNGTILDVNPAAESIIGERRSSLVNRSIRVVAPPAVLAKLEGFLASIRRADTSPVHDGLELTMLDGQTKTLDMWARVVREPGLEDYVAVILNDVTDEKLMQRRLIESERLASIGSMAGYVAHEINNPLANIALLVAASRRKSKDAEVLDKLEKIDTQRRHAASIISDVLSFSKQREVQGVETDLREIIDEAAERVAASHSPSVRFFEEWEGPVLVTVDPLQMGEVFANLLKNAFEATTEGSVTIRIQDRQDAVEVQVIDTGQGMSPETLERIFTPFFTTKQSEGGTGLGLSLCKSVMAAHGGDVQARSEPGKGSTFTVTIPRRRADEDSHRGR